MTGPVSSVTQNLLTPSAATTTPNASQPKPQAAGGDSVHLSDAAQAKIAESKSGCSG
jgi:hypothetical protein